MIDLSKVSIIIPVFNAQDHLERCIKSALAQTYANIEVILINDGSTDNSDRICRLFSADKRIKYYKQNNSGVSSARNAGIKIASGDYVFFLDSDDEIEKNVIANLVKASRKGVLTSCSIKRKLMSGEETLILRKHLYSAKKAEIGIINNNLQGFICGYLFTRISIPQFDERTGYCEDILFLIDYLKINKVAELHFLTKDFGSYLYIQHANSVTNSNTKVIKKLNDIVIAMDILNEKTEYTYQKEINNKKVSLFEYEMQHAKWDEVKKIVLQFNLPKYTGTSFRMRCFSYLYTNKKVLSLKYYFAVLKTIKRIASTIGCNV